MNQIGILDVLSCLLVGLLTMIFLHLRQWVRSRLHSEIIIRLLLLQFAFFASW